MSSASVHPSYFPARSAARSGDGRGDGALLNSDYRPTEKECSMLAAPIAEFLQNCTCYDMLGVSTQVVVLDVEAPLAVAFIAAQETRIQSCVLWDAKKHEYVGVLTSTDYIRILLYCEKHPQEAEAVASWTIKHWCSVKNTLDAAATTTPAKDRSGGSLSPVTRGLVSCRTDTSLHDCLAKMRDYSVRRIVALAEKEGEDYSLVAMLDVEQVVEYLGVMFFHIEKAGGSIGGSGLTTPQRSVSNLSTSSGRGGCGGGGATLKGELSSSSCRAGSGSEASQNISSMHRAGAEEDETLDDIPGVFSLGEAYVLPPYVYAIISQAEAGTMPAAMAELRVGPYNSIFDVPFAFIPHVGTHRARPIYITMDHKLSDALKEMLKYDVECVAVCDPRDQSIINVVSRSDLLRMENQGVYDTQLTVRQALGGKMSERIFVFHERDTLRDIFSHFVRRRVKELFVVDPDTGKLVGQLNVAEFIFFLVFAWVKPKQ